MINKSGLVNVTPNDTNTYSPPLKRLMVGVAAANATVTVVDIFGTSVTLENLPQGTWIKFHNSPIQKVMATGTTATVISGDVNPEN